MAGHPGGRVSTVHLGLVRGATEGAEVSGVSAPAVSAPAVCRGVYRARWLRAICARTYDWIYCAIRIIHLTLEGQSTPPTAFDASERDMAIALQSRRGVGHLLMTRTYTNTWDLPLGGYEPFENPSTGILSVRTQHDNVRLEDRLLCQGLVLIRC